MLYFDRVDRTRRFRKNFMQGRDIPIISPAGRVMADF